MEIKENKVYELWHIYDLEEDEGARLIGIYSSKKNAQRAIPKLKGHPDFRDKPNNFRVYESELDRIGWSEGFISVEEAMREKKEN